MKRQIITLCGSTRFRDEFHLVERALTLEGHIPLPPAFYGKAEQITYSADLCEHLFALHLDKIRISDAIYVVDPHSYVGESTKKEISFAEHEGKQVRYYSQEEDDIKKILSENNI